jgi:fructokinase
MRIGGIEAGGTKWVCAVGGEGGELERVESFPTTTPAETIGRALEFFAAVPDLEALAAALGVPIALDTDVNAAAVGEWRQGAAKGLDTFVYLTVGTGIGGGVFANGRPVHGLLHPEVGHTMVSHDRSRDPFEGSCPYHGDCLEGLASGTALRARWGRPGQELTDPKVWELEAEYLALGLANVVLIVAAERIVLGGGVGCTPGLIERVRVRLPEVLAGYIDVPELQPGPDLDAYLVPPALDPHSGVIGAIALASSR